MMDPYRISSVLSTKMLVFALAFVLLSSFGSVQATHGNNGQSISGASPFPADLRCSSASLAGIHHTEIDPHIAVNPNDSKNIAVAWTQDWADGIVVGVSHDGGETWENSVAPLTSRCVEGEYPTAQNAHIAFGPEGHLYLSTWNYLQRRSLGGRITVHVSTDKGITWGSPVEVERTSFPADLHFPDHWSWVVADPRLKRSGTVYAAWNDTDLVRETVDGSAGEMGFARSIDGGKKWTSPRLISPAPPGYDRYLPTLVVLPDGSLVNVFLQAEEWPYTSVSLQMPGSAMAAHSVDGGNTWSEPVEIAARLIGGDPDRRVQKLGPGCRPCSANLPAVSSGGTIYYTWPVVESDGSSKLYLTSSSDKGVTWAAPEVIRESNVPMGATNIAVAADDTVHVLFYDFRNDAPDDDKATTDVWLISAAGSEGPWEERHVAGPFDLFSVPEGFTIGTTQGIAAVPGGLISAYTLGAPLSTVGPTDIFFSRLPIAPAGAEDGPLVFDPE